MRSPENVSLSFLRAWYAKAYVHIPKEKRDTLSLLPKHNISVSGDLLSFRIINPIDMTIVTLGMEEIIEYEIPGERLSFLPSSMVCKSICSYPEGKEEYPIFAPKTQHLCVWRPS
jgi:hypothetical protein